MEHKTFQHPQLSLWYRSIRALMRVLFFLLTDFKVYGRENIPEAGPLMITTNHISMVDLPAVMVAIPHQTTALAAHKHRNGLAGLILRRFDMIFVHRGTPDRRALRQALAVLENGGVLGLAPEGTRSPSKKLIRGKPGAAFLALRSNAIILPIGLTGTEKIIPAWRRLRRPKIRVVIGEPYRLEAPGDGRQRDLQALSDQMMLRIAGLLPEAYHGVYTGWDGITTKREHIKAKARET